MKERDVETGFIIRLDRGEHVIETITGFCERRGITSGFFRAIGSVRNSELGFYDISKKEYFFRTFTEDREVASMTGNIAEVDGKPFIHSHAVLSACDESLSTVGGHIKECDVAVTLEVFLEPFKAAVGRELNDEIGLKLLKL